MGIPLDTVSYTGETAIAENRRLDENYENQALRRLTTSWTIIAKTKVEIPLGSTSYANATQLYASLVTMLDAAVTSGAFTTRLVSAASAAGATELVSVNVTAVSNSAVEVDDALDTLDDDRVLNTGAIIGIAIGGLMLLLVFFAAVYYFFAINNKVGVLPDSATMQLVNTPG
ncbi:hypothetical protein B484DRAFT_406801 [Ochromonadaceae sp. CCMP2298]|nr:hypothetical protein B484DRAFT_406801 [Ochromonadaceae sp. CCMP2298]